MSFIGLCRDWRLGWCRTLPIPVSIQSCVCCPVAVVWYPKLCHTQYYHSPAWSEQWPGTASEVCLCVLPTSSEQPLAWGWAPPCTASSAHWCFFIEGRESHHSMRNFVDSSTGRGVFPILMLGGLWILDRGAVKCTNFCTFSSKPKTVPCCPFLYGIYCLLKMFMVSRDCQWKLFDMSSTYKALRISLATQEGSSLIFSHKTCHSQDTTSWYTFIWIKFTRVWS